MACYFVLDDPEYLKDERVELLKKPLNFDYIGFGLLALTMSSWEIMLSKGQQWDWLGDPFWRVQTLLIVFVGGLILLVFRELRISNPVVNFRPLGERNFMACCIIIFCAYARALRAEHVAPGFATDLVRIRRLPFGPGALSVRHLLDRRAPHRRQPCWAAESMRWLIGAGLAVLGIAELLDVADEPRDQSLAGRLAPRSDDRRSVDDLCSAECSGLPLHAQASARRGRRALALLRNEGGSVGTSLAQTIQERREQFHTLRLGEYLDRFNPAVNSFARQSQAALFRPPATRRSPGR